MASLALIKILQDDGFMCSKAQLLGIIKTSRNPLSAFPKIMASNNLDIVQIMDFYRHKNRYKLTTLELWDIEIVSGNKKLLNIARYCDK